MDIASSGVLVLAIVCYALAQNRESEAEREIDMTTRASLQQVSKRLEYRAYMLAVVALLLGIINAQAK
jgi:hypothetical protein